MDVSDCIIQGLWRILGSAEYREKLYCFKDLAKLLNAEYDLSGTSRIEWRKVQAAIKKRQPLDKPDEYFILWRDGVDPKPAHTNSVPAPLRVKKAVVNVSDRGGNRVAVLGWCKDKYGQGLAVSVKESIPDARLRIGSIEKDRMAMNLSGDDSCGEGSGHEEERAPYSATAGRPGDGSDRTPPPPSSGRAATASNGGTRTRTRRVTPLPSTSDGAASESTSSRGKRKRCEEDEPSTLAHLPNNYICIAGKYYQVPAEALSSLSALIESKKCEEFRLPRGNDVDDDVPAVDPSTGQAAAPKCTGVKVQYVGKGENRRGYIISSAHDLVRVSDHNELKLLRRVYKRLVRILCGTKGQRFAASPHHRRLLGLGIAMAPKASGEAIEAVMCFTRAGILCELIQYGMKLPRGHTIMSAAFGSASKATVRNLLLDLATDIKLTHIKRILNGELTEAHLTGDGGDRLGMKHYPKLLSMWDEANDCVEEHYADNFQCGSTSDDVVESTEQSLAPYVKAGLIVTGGTFDQGGGGNGNLVMPKLVSADVIVGCKIYNPCMFHCWQKPLEIAIRESMGVGGLGRRTVVQLAISCWHLMKCYPLDQFRKLWEEAVQHGIEGVFDGKWDDERDRFAHAFEILMQAIEEGLAEGLSMFQSIKRALITRWRYVNEAIRHIFENFLQWYWVSRGIRNLTIGKSEGRAGKIARGILSLMRQCADSADVLAASDVPFTYDDDFERDLVGIDEETSPFAQGPPQLYVQACFLKAFDEECWTPFYLFCNRTNPIPKKEAYMSQDMPTGLSMASDRIDHCREWRSINGFKEFRRLVESVPVLGEESKGGREYFIKMADVFMENFRKSFDKQVHGWLDTAHVHYSLFCSQPDIAVATAKFINDSQDIVGDQTPVFESRSVTLPPILQIYDDVKSVNIRKVMEYITAAVKCEEVIEQPFVASNSEAILHMAYEEKPAAEIEDNTLYFNGKKSVFCRTSHQQKAEFMVNEGGLCASTGRGENSRNWLMNIRINLLHKINDAARDKVNEAGRLKFEAAKAARVAASTDADSDGDGDANDGDGNGEEDTYEDVKRLWGVSKLGPILEYMSDFSGEVDKAKLNHPTLYKELRELMDSKAELFSTLEKERGIENFVGLLDAEPRMTARELEAGLDITAALCGAVVLSNIQSGQGHLPYLDAELKERGVKDFKNKDGEVKKIEECGFIEKRHALRRHECGWLKANRGITIDNEPDLKVVKPQSEKLKELIGVASPVVGDKTAAEAEDADEAE